MALQIVNKHYIHVPKHHVKLGQMCQRIYKLPQDLHVKKLSSKSSVIVIEGTDSLDNWKDNLSFLFRNKYDIHRGFYRYAHELIVKYELAEVFATNDTIIITAHSLGAAAALIIVYLLYKRLHYIPNIELVLFGCPKLGGKTFQSIFNQLSNITIHNYKNRNDVVSNLPIGFGYTHVYQPIQLNRSLFFFIPSVIDHNLSKYIDSMKKLQ